MDNHKNNQNAMQDIKIAQMEKDISFIKEKISDIKEQVTNDIPHALQKLQNKIEDFRASNSKWLVGMLTALIMTLIGVIMNFIRITVLQ